MAVQKKAAKKVVKKKAAKKVAPKKKVVKKSSKKVVKKVSPKKTAPVTPKPTTTVSTKAAALQPKTKNIKLAFILDRSGSMTSVKEDTIGGFNQYLADLRKLQDNDFLVSLTQFDDVIENVYVDLPLSKVPDLTNETFVPRGSTALNDATGRTIKGIPTLLPDDTSVLVIIFTDGFENASKEYSGDDVKKLIAEKEATGNYTIVYLGASPSSIASARSMGISAANTVQYNSQNTIGTMSQLSKATAVRSVNFRGGATSTSSFFADAGLDQTNISPDTPTPYTAPTPAPTPDVSKKKK